MDHEERLSVAFHEAGHSAMHYWRRESLHSRWIMLNEDRYGGATHVPLLDLDESDLMILIAGPLAQLLHLGVMPVRAIRFPREYRIATSDSARIRACVRGLRGKDDLPYQFGVQERVREILQRPIMWEGITAAAERLSVKGKLSGEQFEAIFERLGVPDQFGARRRAPGVSRAERLEFRRLINEIRGSAR